MRPLADVSPTSRFPGGEPWRGTCSTAGHGLAEQLNRAAAGATALLVLLDVAAPTAAVAPTIRGEDGAKSMNRRCALIGALPTATLVATATLALQDAQSMPQAPIPGGFSLRALVALLLGLAAAVVVVVLAHSAWAAKRLRGKPLQDADTAVRRLGGRNRSPG
jgi:hypothetical protein